MDNAGSDRNVSRGHSTGHDPRFTALDASRPATDLKVRADDTRTPQKYCNGCVGTERSAGFLASRHAWVMHDDGSARSLQARVWGFESQRSPVYAAVKTKTRRLLVRRPARQAANRPPRLLIV